MSENPEETPTHLKEFFIFAPFQPFLSRFDLLGVLPIVQSRPMLPGAPSAALSSREAHKDRRTREQGNKGTREAQHHRPAPPTDKDGSQSGTQREKEPEQVRNERKRGSEKPSKPTKKGTPPPLWAGSRQPFPSSQIRAKKSAKSHLG